MDHIDNDFTKMAYKIIDSKIKVAKAFIDKKITPIADFGSPERVVGKKYENWTPQDFIKAQAIFQNNEKANQWLVRKEMKRTAKLEQEVKKLEGR